MLHHAKAPGAGVLRRCTAEGVAHRSQREPGELRRYLRNVAGSPSQPEHIHSELDSPHYGGGSYECLLLEQADAQLGTFRRIGYVHFQKMLYSHTPETEEQIERIDRETCQILDAQFRSYGVPKHLYYSVDDDYMYTIKLV